MHESFHLWESNISGFLLNKDKDFVTLSADGIGVLALGRHPKRRLVSASKENLMIHSLESVNYLKIDVNNSLVFEFSGEQKVISVNQ